MGWYSCFRYLESQLVHILTFVVPLVTFFQLVWCGDAHICSNSRICLVIICLVHTNLLNTLNVCVLTCGLIVQTCGLIVQPSKLSYSYAIMLHSWLFSLLISTWFLLHILFLLWYSHCALLSLYQLKMNSMINKDSPSWLVLVVYYLLISTCCLLLNAILFSLLISTCSILVLGSLLSNCVDLWWLTVILICGLL